MTTVVTPDQLRHAADDLLRASRATRYIDGVRAVRDAIRHVHAGVDWLHPLDCTGLWREFPAAMAGLAQAARLRLLVEALFQEQAGRAVHDPRLIVNQRNSLLIQFWEETT